MEESSLTSSPSTVLPERHEIFKGHKGIFTAGHGTFELHDGTILTGEWKDGYFKKGTKKFPNGNILEGTFDSNEKLFGQGFIKFTDGCVYRGEFIDGKANGKGFFKWNDGCVYIGEFIDGNLNGQGNMTYSSGTVHQGEYKNGNRHGKGTYKYDNGDVYEGEWKDGKENGKGTLKCTNGDVYEGEWKDGKENGKGTFKYPSGSVYEGNFKNGWFNGKGIKKCANGDVYEGEWKDDEENGKGIKKCANGDVYEGEWKDGRFNGKGTIRTPNGYNITSRFYQNNNYCLQFKGQTTFCFPDGNIFNGKFFNLIKNKGELTYKNGNVVSGIMKNTRKRLGWTSDGIYCWKFIPDEESDLSKIPADDVSNADNDKKGKKRERKESLDSIPQDKRQKSYENNEIIIID